MASQTRAGGAIDPTEKAEWLDSLEDVLRRHGPAQAQQLLALLNSAAARAGVQLPAQPATPYLNTIPAQRQPRYPGDREVERRLTSIIRWNALAMVVRA